MKNLKSLSLKAAPVLAVLVLAACASKPVAPPPPASPVATPTKHEHAATPNKVDKGMGEKPGAVAIATLTPTQGNAVRGMVMFHEKENGSVMLHAKVSGLKPNAVHGFHVHEKGDCASADGTSAGGHYNPKGVAHGAQNAVHHAGDMPSLQADALGNADLKVALTGISVKDPSTTMVGRAVVIHANPDDFATQPAGNSGPRIACGVIAGH